MFDFKKWLMKTPDYTNVIEDPKPVIFEFTSCVWLVSMKNNLESFYLSTPS